MPDNYILLEKIVVGAAGAESVTFSNIPQTGYTDLILKGTVKTTQAATYGLLGIRPNGSTSSITGIRVYGGDGNAYADDTATLAFVSGTSTESNTFGSFETYIPNYAGSGFKTFTSESTGERNQTNDTYMGISSILWSNTAAITSLQIMPQAVGFVEGCTFYLYGVAKLGTTPAIAPMATGGDIIDTDGTYWYHTFLSSGTFTPQRALSADYLVVAGGGAGGSNSRGGGGGAGGLRSTVTATGGGGSLETALSLGTSAYTVTVGAGGAGTTGQGLSGNNSVFSTITSTGGGGGAEGGVGGSTKNGLTGGSGGGGGGYSTGTGGAGTANQGYAGGTGSTNPYYGGGGGGGAGAVGAASNTDNGAAGGNGVTTSISGTSRTYAGGGGGGTTATGGAGGTGGGGAGVNLTTSNPGTANTGSGGGGAGSNGGNGGSGIVIVRYAV